MRRARGEDETTTNGQSSSLPVARENVTPRKNAAAGEVAAVGTVGLRAPTRKELRVAAAFRRVRDHISIEQASVGMVTHRVTVPARDVVFVKGIFEASDGVAAVFAEAGGELSLVTPHSREAALGEILADLGIDMSTVERTIHGSSNGT